MSTPAKAFDRHPVRKLATAAATCSSTAAAYGACVAGNYKEVNKEMCAAEFNAFKQCVQGVMKRKW
ncbi:hypothetical protein M407DRAFT_28715 [Tulasnella calospora MUT 4182]|uniref:CHCH domain-containing protein n=1 Tax=Tulasnella calospora MUT 4182 TaxID=1051891 RepID=A0A0C3Q0Y4_9AGAM|nr:hypothetical protein M407DRAFT_28715 [Tulasnella calospora MUT 4182]